MFLRRTDNRSAKAGDTLVRKAETRPGARKAETRPVGRVFNAANHDDMANHDWDDNDGPLAYLITFRTYATWLHGDDRSSVDRHGNNVYGTAKILPSANLKQQMTDNKIAEEFLIDDLQRSVVDRAIRSVCSHRGYAIYALNIRTNHAHSVVSAKGKPEPMMNAFKANSTRELREAGLVDAEQIIWSRGGSTRYLWKPTHVDGAVNYVIYGQGDDLPHF